jgi:hypothetical protein
MLHVQLRDGFGDLLDMGGSMACLRFTLAAFSVFREASRDANRFPAGASVSVG